MTFLLDCTIKTSVILAVALASLRCFRKRSAAFRHNVLAIAIVFSAITPILGLVMPSWYVDPVITEQALVVPVQSLMSASTIEPPNATGVPGTESPARQRLVAYLPAIIWLIGVSIGVFVLITGLARLVRVASASQPMVDGRWTTLAAAISREYGLRRSVRLLLSQNSSILVTWGMLRPEIILPAGASEWPAERAGIVLRHELAHIRRLDWVVQMTAQALRVMYWFNPLLWIVCVRLRLESEYACDDAALSTGIDGPEYAAHLLDVARALNKPHRAWSAALPMARLSGTERRFAAMLNPTLNRDALTRRAVVGTTVALLMLTLPIAAFRGTGQNTPLTLSGSVYDASGAVLPGVGMTLEDKRQIKLTATSDASGRFEFASVAPGRYVLEASLAGFRSLRHDFELRRARDWDQSITLQVGDIQETVNVTAKRGPESRPSSRPATAPLRVGGNIRAPRKLLHVAPVYPAAMREAGYEGVVPMQALIGVDGTVVSVRVLSAQVHPEFARAAMDAVRQWRFDSTLLNGEPVEVVMTVSVRFSLAD